MCRASATCLITRTLSNSDYLSLRDVRRLAPISCMAMKGNPASPLSLGAARRFRRLCRCAGDRASLQAGFADEAADEELGAGLGGVTQSGMNNLKAPRSGLGAGHVPCTRPPCRQPQDLKYLVAIPLLAFEECRCGGSEGIERPAEPSEPAEAADPVSCSPAPPGAGTSTVGESSASSSSASASADSTAAMAGRSRAILCWPGAAPRAHRPSTHAR